MEKTPSLRYQTARGLKSDLDRAAKELAKPNGFNTMFELGVKDMSYQFLIPDILFGRENETSLLSKAFNQTTKSVTPGLVLVTGTSGVGKSRLVNELDVSVAKQGAFLVNGKCEQIGSKPMISIIQALTKLVRMILLLSDGEIDQVKKLISENVLHPGLLVNAGINDFAALYDNKLPQLNVNGMEVQDAFKQAITGFLKAVSTMKSVVLVLEDVQWGDHITFALIEAIFVSSSSCGGVLLVMTCRDDELAKDHILWQTMDRIAASIGKDLIERIHLSSFDEKLTRTFIFEIMKANTKNENGIQLAKIVFSKTMMKSLYNEGHIRFIEDKGSGRWHADVETIRKVAQASENVVKLVTKEIHKVDPETLKLLQYASAIGSFFTLTKLMQTLQIPASSCIASLNIAIMLGIIQPESPWAAKLTENVTADTLTELLKIDSLSYKWLHDKTQQAAYETVQVPDRPFLHLQIGRTILSEFDSNVNNEVEESKIFEVTKHYEIAIQNKKLVDSLEHDEKRGMALTFLRAAQKAISSLAIDSALKFIDIGMTYLNNEDRQIHYDTVFAACRTGFRVGMIMFNEDFRNRMLREGLEMAKDKIDVATLITADGLRLIYEGSPKCLDRIWEALDVIGFKLTRSISYSAMKRVVKDCRKRLLKVSDEDWKTFTIDTSAESNAICTALRLISFAGFNFDMLQCIHLGAQGVLYQLLRKEINPNILGGWLQIYCKIYLNKKTALAGYMLGGFWTKIIGPEEFARIGDVMLLVVERFPKSVDRATAPWAAYSHAFIWSRDYRLYVDNLYQTFLSGHHHFGEYSVSGSCAALWMASLFFMGKPLNEILALKDQINIVYKSFIRADIKLRFAVIHQVAHSLANKSFELNGPYFGDKEKEKATSFSARAQTSLTVFLHGYANLALWEKDWKKASTIIESMRAVQQRFGIASILEKQWHYLDALVSIRLLNSKTCTISERYKYLRNFKAGKKALKSMARWTPMTEQHRYYLIKAELAVYRRQKTKALHYYNLAISTAEANHFINEAGLANELCAKFMQSYDAPIGVWRGCIIEAYSCYQKWGANALLKQLQSNYSFLRDSPLLKGLTAMDLTIPSNENLQKFVAGTDSVDSSADMHETVPKPDMIWDFRSLLKAAQDISDQTELKDTMKKTLDVVLENSGAWRAVLVKQIERTDISSLVILSESSVSDKNTINVHDSPPKFPQTLLKYVCRMQQTLVLHDISKSPFASDIYFEARRVKSVLCTPLSGQSGKNLRLVAYLEHPTDGVFTEERVQILNVLLKQAALDIDKAQTSEAVHRFVPLQLLDLLGVQSITDAMLGDTVLKQVAVFFADIRDFTRISENLSCEQNFEFVNALLSVLVPELERHHLVVDKIFFADTVCSMALCAGESESESANLAVRAGVAVQVGLRKFNKIIHNYNWPPIVENVRLGIGIHSGDTILGLVGSKDRMNVTIISDTVNTASRIESITKKYGATLIISQTTYDHLTNPSEFNMRILDEVIFKGKSESLRLYEVIDAECDPETREAKIKCSSSYELGFRSYWEGSVVQATTHFENVLQIYPGDKAALLFIERCSYWLKKGVPEVWDPIWQMDSK
ncbi:hypothetical protein HDU76_013194 [Blyttiomyces sp. JEL0837]|nr:hypothetical protein HDU76_013194 [Blyttiomyces sp. JEL0837]